MKKSVTFVDTVVLACSVHESEACGSVILCILSFVAGLKEHTVPGLRQSGTTLNRDSAGLLPHATVQPIG